MLLLVPHRDQQESTKRGSFHQRISVLPGRRALRPFFLQGVPCGRRPPRTLRGLDGAGEDEEKKARPFELPVLPTPILRVLVARMRGCDM